MQNGSTRKMETGLSYHGITIIDSTIAKELKNKLLQHCKSNEELHTLINLLEQAIADDKYIIHFGI